MATIRHIRINRSDGTSETYDVGGSSSSSGGVGAKGEGSNAEKFNDYTNNHAEGSYSHAEGYGTAASGDNAHAEGYRTTASGLDSHAEGLRTTASGDNAHAEGEHTTASSMDSHAEGYHTTAQRRSQHVFGEYNVPDTEGTTNNTYGKYVEIVGNGTLSARSNARTLDWSGNEALAGTLSCKGLAGDAVNVSAKSMKGKYTYFHYCIQRTGAKVGLLRASINIRDVTTNGSIEDYMLITGDELLAIVREVDADASAVVSASGETLGEGTFVPVVCPMSWKDLVGYGTTVIVFTSGLGIGRFWNADDPNAGGMWGRNSLGQGSVFDCATVVRWTR